MKMQDSTKLSSARSRFRFDVTHASHRRNEM